MICEKITGQVMNIFVSIILAVVLAVISFGLGLHFYPKVNVEEII